MVYFSSEKLDILKITNYLCNVIIKQKHSQLKITVMRRKIEKTDFRFRYVSYGRYKVIYTSPVTGKEWKCETTDMEIIDAIFFEDKPKVKYLNELKGKCKRG